jgi:hypothetical protein
MQGTSSRGSAAASHQNRSVAVITAGRATRFFHKAPSPKPMAATAARVENGRSRIARGGSHFNIAPGVLRLAGVGARW